MKKWVVYILGIVTGIVLTFAALFIIGFALHSELRGLTIFEKPGEYMNYSHLEVFQVLDEGCALANTDEFNTVLILPDENQHFYDRQEINLTGNQRIQRVGTYKYPNRENFELTVPAIRIVEE